MAMFNSKLLVYQKITCSQKRFGPLRSEFQVEVVNVSGHALTLKL